ncbi:hypothetical protein OIE67_44085 [Nonomuraea fuscirosea]|uniref:hypothetical protein n=1 Tax=Nonomuraea fuscirosea TaxID=1291556 RepID=UPI002DD8450D|nr:hypothetical protein [Nonomuraea fuscirosea]WSA50971.1 hypothetical protein OIE67_44085 [Nonomuraea fuscirosea]
MRSAIAKEASRPRAGRRRSVFAGVDVCEAAGLRLRPGSHRPRFEEPVWLLDGLADAPVTMGASEKCWDFAIIGNPRWRVLVQEHLLALATPRHEAVAELPHAFRTRRSPRTCYLVLKELASWFNWLTGQGVNELDEVTQDHCAVYLHERSFSKPTRNQPQRRLDPDSLKKTVAAVQSIAYYGELYSTDRYRDGFVPWNGQKPYKVVGLKITRANKIPALPDNVLRPLLAAALFMVDVIGPHLASLLDETGGRPAPGRSCRWPTHDVLVVRADDETLVPWTAPSMTAREINGLVALATTAAQVVTSAVTGMRSSELAEIVVGSRKNPVPAPGGGLRFRLASKVIKGREFGGDDDEWVVLPEADRAVALAERFVLARPSRARDRHVFPAWNTELYWRFRAWVNGPGGRQFGLEPIPDGPCTPRMLRRKLAQEIARRPGGLLAAKVALKHVSVVTTEGYCNRPDGSQAMFLAEVEQAQEEHHLRLTADIYRDYTSGIMPTGPGARHLIDAFEHIDNVLKESSQTAPVVMDTERRIENMLRATAGALHIGTANYCWFRDPAQALCLRMAGAGDATKPLAGLCDSSRCPQATHHPCHRPVWQDRAETFEVFLGNPRFPAGEKKRLRPEYERTLKVLTLIDASEGPNR